MSSAGFDPDPNLRLISSLSPRLAFASSLSLRLRLRLRLLSLSSPPPPPPPPLSLLSSSSPRLRILLFLLASHPPDTFKARYHRYLGFTTACPKTYRQTLWTICFLYVTGDRTRTLACTDAALQRSVFAILLEQMHIVGVIIHGNPDRRYFFVVYPHLAGDSNLNLECIRLALLADRKHGTLRPNLLVMVDNASDNKSRFTIGGLAWLVAQGLVNQVEVAMLPVGHTHEDIDQVHKPELSASCCLLTFCVVLRHFVLLPMPSFGQGLWEPLTITWSALQPRGRESARPCR